MKKRIAIAALAVIILLSIGCFDWICLLVSGGRTENFLPYKLYVQGKESADSYPCAIGGFYGVGGCMFYKTYTGRDMLISFDGSFKEISQLRAYRYARPLHVEFIGAEGMDIVDLFCRVGPPTYNGTGGFYNVLYKMYDGSTYYITVGQNNKISSVILKSANHEQINLSQFHLIIGIVWITLIVVITLVTLLILRKRKALPQTD